MRQTIFLLIFITGFSFMKAQTKEDSLVNVLEDLKNITLIKNNYPSLFGS
jgi:hypothetical protein